MAQQKKGIPPPENKKNYFTMQFIISANLLVYLATYYISVAR